MNVNHNLTILIQEKTHSVMKSLKREMSLVPQHRLLDLLGTNLERPAIWKALENGAVSSIKLQDCDLIGFGGFGGNERGRTRVVAEVLGQDDGVEDLADLTRHSDANAVR